MKSPVRNCTVGAIRQVHPELYRDISSAVNHCSPSQAIRGACPCPFDGLRFRTISSTNSHAFREASNNSQPGGNMNAAHPRHTASNTDFASTTATCSTPFGSEKRTRQFAMLHRGLYIVLRAEGRSPDSTSYPTVPKIALTAGLTTQDSVEVKCG